ncbi:hypothetical protein [Salinicoccus sp. Marseille-QA3877]
MSREHLNSLLVKFITFITVFALLYVTSAYILTFITPNINWAMVLHILNIGVMFILSLFITKHLGRWIAAKIS